MSYNNSYVNCEEMVNENDSDVINVVKSPLDRFILNNFKNLDDYKNYYKLIHPYSTEIDRDVINMIKLDNEIALNFLFDQNIFGRQF